MRIADIDDEMVSSNFLEPTLQIPPVRYGTVHQMTGGHRSVLDQPIYLGRGSPSVNRLIVTHADKQTLHRLSMGDLSFIVVDNDSFVKSDPKPTPFHANVFQRHTIVVLDELHDCHSEHDKE